MKEITIYSIAAIAGLTVLGYSVHMFIGGLVNAHTEILIITAVCIIGALVIAYMAWDVVQHRKRD